MVHSLKEDGYRYMLFKRKRFTRDPVKDKPASTRSVLDRVTELHPDLFPHGV